MGKLAISLLAILIAVGVAVLGSPTASADSPPAQCGPDPNGEWVDRCVGPPPAPHPDMFPNSGALVGLSFTNQCQHTDFSLIMTGPVEVDRQDASDVSGAPYPPAGSLDGDRDVIETEIVSMTLQSTNGFTLRVGVNTPGINPAVPRTLGDVHEQATHPSLADSFFDVFFEVSGVPGPHPNVYNHQVLLVTSVINQVPPVGARYLHPTGICIPLWDDPVSEADPPVVYLVTAEHDPSGFVGGQVGGIVELPDIAQGGAAAGASGNSGISPGGSAAIAGGMAAALLAVGTGGWYVRRRLVRR